MTRRPRGDLSPISLIALLGLGVAKGRAGHQHERPPREVPVISGIGATVGGKIGHVARFIVG